MSRGFLVVSRFGQPKTDGSDVVEILPRIFVADDERVVGVDCKIEPRNKTGEPLRSRQGLIHKLPVKAAVQIGREDECVLGNVAVVEVQCKGYFVPLIGPPILPFQSRFLYGGNDDDCTYSGLRVLKS